MRKFISICEISWDCFEEWYGFQSDAYCRPIETRVYEVEGLFTDLEMKTVGWVMIVPCSRSSKVNKEAKQYIFTVLYRVKYEKWIKKKLRKQNKQTAKDVKKGWHFSKRNSFLI